MALLSINGWPPIFRQSSIFLTQKSTKPFRLACGASTQKSYWSNTETFESPAGGNDSRNGHFLTVKFATNYEQKMDEVRCLLIKFREEDSIESLIFVDAIQRLGVGHNYQDEIHTILTMEYAKTREGFHRSHHSLHDVSLSFRLLRQRGYHVSADVFKYFKDKHGGFEGKHGQDIRGLLELYEATQLSFEGETLLDEAQEFSSQLLYEHVTVNMDRKWSNRVHTRLKHPYHKSITKMTEKHFLRDFEGMKRWGVTLKELVEMDFVIGKYIHEQELIQVSKWWNDLGLTRELKLARNQPLKWYIWSMTVLISDISLSVERVLLTKSIAFIYLIDDIFDIYGKPDELALFTEAVDKWDYGVVDMLPDYMKMCYKALLDTTNEIGHIISEKHGYNPISDLKKAWASLCNAFSVEAKWLATGDLPRAEVYLANGKVSSGVHVVLVHLFFLLGIGGTHKDSIKLDGIQTIISSVAAILRLWDDLGSAKDEHQNGKDGSYIECYMKDHPDLQFKQVREHVVMMISTEWKRLNKECFRLNQSSSASLFQEGSLNLARMVPLMYDYDENQRLPILEEYVNFMLLSQAASENH